jgi:peroxiredoxin
MIKQGEALPAATVHEFVEVAREGCAIGPNALDIQAETKGKRVVIFGVPGAFTPTCSEKHLPGYVARAEEFRAKGVDEIWCISVNDAFVMHAWGKQQSAGSVRMIADGSALLTRALGLEQDLSARGMGPRSLRYAMVVNDGVVESLFVEAPGKFEVSEAAAVLASL